MNEILAGHALASLLTHSGFFLLLRCSSLPFPHTHLTHSRHSINIDWMVSASRLILFARLSAFHLSICLFILTSAQVLLKQPIFTFLALITLFLQTWATLCLLSPISFTLASSHMWTSASACWGSRISGVHLFVSCGQISKMDRNLSQPLNCCPFLTLAVVAMFPIW